MRQAPRNWCLPLLGAFALFARYLFGHSRCREREQDIVDLRLGQRILVDDGSCPAGQIKEVYGARMTESGILRSVRCIPRSGTKK